MKTTISIIANFVIDQPEETYVRAQVSHGEPGAVESLEVDPKLVKFLQEHITVSNRPVLSISA